MRWMIATLAAAGMLAAGFGCSRTLDRERASYHEHKAERDAARGNYRAAAKQQDKADIARDHEARDVLP